VARSERFELPTLGFEVRCSIQLSYERNPVKADTWHLCRPQDLSLNKRTQIRGQGCIRASSACQSTRGCLGVNAPDFRVSLCAGPLRLIFFGLRRALRPLVRIGLRVADGLGQHLAQLGLRLGWLLREARFLPVSHNRYMGCLREN
jgi:hypothetical protein